MSSVGGIRAQHGGADGAARVLNAGVVEAARRRQRRRRLRLSAALVLAIAVGAAARESLRGAGLPTKAIGSSAARPRVPFAAPATVLSQTPYMGVHCPQPDAITCDRVGLAIWLKRPAISVDATIAGQPLKLDWFGEQPRFASTQPRTEFAGYLRPAGLTTRFHVKPTAAASVDPRCGCRVGPEWNGGDPPSPLVELQIQYPDHTRVLTHLHVFLAHAWG